MIIEVQETTSKIQESRTWSEYRCVCYDQYVLVRKALSTMHMLSLSLWWIFGKAIWMTLYDYEVIFQDNDSIVQIPIFSLAVLCIYKIGFYI